MTSTKRRLIRAGALAWIIGTPVFFITELITQSAWPHPYSWATNAISDLGAVHCASTGADNPPPRYLCSPLHTLMNTSVITLGILLAAGAVLTGPAWGRGAVSRTARSLFVASGAGMVLAALDPEDVNLNLHVLGAFLIMGFGSTGFMLTGLARRDSQIGRLRMLTLPLSAVSVAATWLMFSHHTPVLGYGGMERVALYPLLCWTVITGAHLLRAATRPASSQHTQSVGPARSSSSQATNRKTGGEPGKGAPAQRSPSAR
jgi:hypothetical membrane protein